MPTGSRFSFSVCVGPSPVEELAGKDEKVYIETNLNVPDVSFTKEEWVLTAHGEKERQTLPVTPYTVHVSVHGTRDDTVYYWFEMYVDGSRVWNKPLRNGHSMKVEGTMDRKAGVFRELLFSLPRYQTNKADRIEDGRQAEIGTITIVCMAAIPDGVRQMTYYDRDLSLRGQGLHAPSDFYQATKHDCASGGLTTTSTGRELFRLNNAAGRTGTQQSFKRGRVLEELTIHYRMRQTLVEMGLLKEPNNNITASLSEMKCETDKLQESFDKMNFGCDTACTILDVDSSNINTSTKSMKKEKMIENDVESEVDGRQSRAVPVVPSIKTRVVEEVITKKNERGEEVKMTRRIESMPLERYVRVDDDLYIVETLDDSVVIVGDDECRVVEPPIQEFPYVELD